ncbi:MAG: S41 family peptidase [Muribaculaceae bacterium]|nr:S41 family peptidase [Muribaculaceae bacterium]
MKKLLPLSLLVVALVCAGASGFSKSQSSKSKDDLARSLNTFNSIMKELYTGYVDTIDGAGMVREAIDNMLAEIDPYTEYYPSDDQDELTTLAQGQYAGIGAYILRRGDSVVVHQPRHGSPSAKAGLLPGDVFVAINGDSVGRGVSVDKVSSRLRGQAGTKVSVTMRRPLAGDSIYTVEITRGNIKVAPVPYYGLLPDGIGYINLTTFSSESAPAVKEALRELMKDSELKGLIIDLRGNGGGYLESAVQIAGNFVPKGTEIVRTRGREATQEKIFKTTQTPVAPKLPLAILTDGSTASASEILAGSMQDLDRAVIVGARSFGKGLVQNTVNLPYGDILKLTRGRYYIPSGRLIQAIDYSHRNPDGSVARTPDSLTSVFHTRAGREVRDGGGITPDVKMPETRTNRLLYSIVSENRAFDFANERHAANPAAGEGFEVDSTVYEAFKEWLGKSSFRYERQSEAGLKYLREAVELEGYMTDSVAAEFDRLAALLSHDLGREMDANREAIIDILEAEMEPRYFDDGEIIRRSLPKDKTVQRARELLLNSDEYKKILSGKK